MPRIVHSFCIMYRYSCPLVYTLHPWLYFIALLSSCNGNAMETNFRLRRNNGWWWKALNMNSDSRSTNYPFVTGDSIWSWSGGISDHSVSWILFRNRMIEGWGTTDKFYFFQQNWLESKVKINGPICICKAKLRMLFSIFLAPCMPPTLTHKKFASDINNFIPQWNHIIAQSQVPFQSQVATNKKLYPPLR